MSSTISSPHSGNIFLGTVTTGGTYQSPLTITASGGVTAGGGFAIYAPNAFGSIANYGTILNTNGYGVELYQGGNLYNKGLTQAFEAVRIKGAAGTVSNAGTITGTASNGIYLLAGGSVTNTGTGLIDGTNGVLVTGASGAVTNSASISGTTGDGVFLGAGGSVSNTGAGVIRGQFQGVYLNGALGTITNSGTITAATSNAIDLLDGGSVTNSGTGLIEGYFGVATGASVNTTTVVNSGRIIGTVKNGVALDDGGTVVDSGTISGANLAISFGGYGDNAQVDRLVLDPGYVLVGKVYGSATAGATNTLELASTASAGTVSTVLATEFENFGTVTVDPGAQWTLTNNNSLTGITLTDFGVLTNSGSLTGAGPLIVDPGTLLNAGYIGLEVTLTNGGYLDNEAGHTVSTTGVAVFGTGAAATIVNAGTIISGATGFGIDLTSGGTIKNSGRITAANAFYSVYSESGGYLSNSSTGYIGSNGIKFAVGGTAVNAGQITDTFGNGVYFGGTTGTLTNSGTINGVGGDGISLNEGGKATNTGAGLIEGTIGVGVYNAAGTVTTSATINGTNGDGVSLKDGGSVGNSGAGLLEGSAIGVYITGAAGTVTNSATIVGTSGDGVDLAAGGTVIDSGTISGGYAVQFGGSSGSNFLILESGYKLTGAGAGVSGSTLGATNTLELSGSLGAVTVNFTGLTVTNFQDVLFASSANSETLKASNTSGTLPVTISGFTLTSGQTIGLTGIANGTLQNGGTVNGSDQLIASNGVDTVTLQLDGSDRTVFNFTSSAGGTYITPACFCRGTLILTAGGEVAVEDLAIGDKVVTLSGAARAVKWIGRRAYDGRFVAANRAVLPIRVAAGALAPGLPARDLFLSSEHALYIDGALVPAGLLVNGATIRQAASVDRLEYFHIELERHDVILAEGAPAETFVDCDSRGIFHNAGEFAELYPDDSPVPWDFCAPRAEEGSAELAAIRAALAERAQAFGYSAGRQADRRSIATGPIPRSLRVVEGPPAGAGVPAIARSVAPAEEIRLAS